MSMMGMTIGVLIYVALSFVAIVIFTSICYELSPYSRRDETVALPEWERKTLFTMAGYPPISLVLLGFAAFVLPGLSTASGNELLTIAWFCGGHAGISSVGAAGAWYLRRRDKRNTVYFVGDLLTGAVYTTCLIALFFHIYG
ncbi:MAG: hypothetical protein H3C54_00215 [Taibaiella sp.]|nr:hypothetical protein [Taibaiella sp.]